MADETSGFPGVADPGRGAERLTERFFRIRVSDIGFVEEARHSVIRLSRYLWRTLSCAAFEGEMSKRPWALTVGVWSVRVLAWKEC